MPSIYKTPEEKTKFLKKFTNSQEAPFKCNKCDFRSDKTQALIMHWHRKHGAFQGSPSEIHARRKKEGLIKTQTPGSPSETAPEKKRMGRPPKDKNKGNGLSDVSSLPFRFCPGCGLDHQAMQIAYDMARKMRGIL